MPVADRTNQRCQNRPGITLQAQQWPGLSCLALMYDSSMVNKRWTRLPSGGEVLVMLNAATL